MMICFVTGQKPLSMQAELLKNYKKRLVEEFNNYKHLYQEIPTSENIYSKIIYIHADSSNLDVDNMSKPFIDAFKGIMYPDDNIINHRTCSKINMDDYNSYELQVDLLPTAVAEKLDELICNRNSHIVYFEIGLFSANMVFFGGARNGA